MANLDLSKYGITDVKEVLHNPSYDVLFAEETKPGLEGFEKGQVTELGAVNVMTGVYTGRSPKDKFFVKNEASGACKVPEEKGKPFEKAGRVYGSVPCHCSFLGRP